MNAVHGSVIALVVALAVPIVHAQDKYPGKPIRMIVPFAPGGGGDTLARLVAPPVSESFGRPVVVDNRLGGAGTIGTVQAARSDADGYTLIVVTASYGANAALYDLPYDPIDGIQPIALLGTTCLVVTVNPALSIKTIPELIAYAKAAPGKLNFGSGGTGDLAHLGSELFKLQTGIVYTHVPYKGSGPVMTALLGGEVDMSFSSLVPSMPHLKAGRLRAIGVTTPKRWPVLPDVPAVNETVAGYDVTHWYGLWGPKGLPQEIVMRWNLEVAKVLRTDAVKKWLDREGVEAAGGPPEEFYERIRNDVQKWKKLATEARISVHN